MSLVDHAKETAINVDKTASHQFYKLAQKFHLKKWLNALEWSCHGIPWLVLVAINVYILADYRFWARLLVGLVLDIVYVALLKASCRRVRPSWGRQQEQMILVGVDKLSFPSGHSSRAVYVALFFTEYSTVLAPFVILWAIAVCASRVAYGRHFIGDVLGGALLGYANWVTQFTLFYPLHTFLYWFLTKLLATGASDYDPDDW